MIALIIDFLRWKILSYYVPSNQQKYFASLGVYQKRIGEQHERQRKTRK